MAPEDYVRVSIPGLRFSACDKEACVSVPIIDDDLVEGEERFLVTLSASDDFDSRITLSPTTAEVIINDDDCE